MPYRDEVSFHRTGLPEPSEVLTQRCNRPIRRRGRDPSRESLDRDPGCPVVEELRGPALSSVAPAETWFLQAWHRDTHAAGTSPTSGVQIIVSLLARFTGPDERAPGSRSSAATNDKIERASTLLL